MADPGSALRFMAWCGRRGDLKEKEHEEKDREEEADLDGEVPRPSSLALDETQERSESERRPQGRKRPQLALSHVLPVERHEGRPRAPSLAGPAVARADQDPLPRQARKRG